jgi:hypothetical protein
MAPRGFVAKGGFQAALPICQTYLADYPWGVDKDRLGGGCCMSAFREQT